MSLQEQFSHERAWRKGPGIAAGSDVESALLGTPNIPREKRHDGYLSFDKAVDFVKEYQPNPLERSRAMKELRHKVAALCTDDRTPVKFFTAIGTPLDVYHGVDAFFEQGGRVATMDISLRAKEIGKADVLVQASLDANGNVAISDEEMTRAADKIAAVLNGNADRLAA